MKKILLASLCVFLAASSVSQAGPGYDVAAGWDLFTTQSSTEFMGVNWEGVSLESHDFGGSIGTKDTGDTDTIVQRLGDANAAGDGDTATIDIELVALQLVSIDPFDIDGDGAAPFGYHYITLQTGQNSTGEMDITFDDVDGGTFESFFDVYFDLRFGGLDGVILNSDVLTMTSSGNAWAREAPLGATVIDDLDHLLNGTDIYEDFWPGVHLDGSDWIADTIIEAHPSGAHHDVAVPEPATLLLLGLGGLLLRRRKNV